MKFIIVNIRLLIQIKISNILFLCMYHILSEYLSFYEIQNYNIKMYYFKG